MQGYLTKSYGCYSIAIEAFFCVEWFLWCLFFLPCIGNQLIISLFHAVYEIDVYLYCLFCCR
ncbi:Uncharacterised protein [Serratia quinivorans]|nr:hypothetical protein [Serratia sp. BIGb0163]CAI1108368.1 Uncharacterised protein [Serratia quinivorans]CAI1788607.1 Uncharacterised protein [Serratia proteamaculans]CAI1870125.1 Uncharacterised protein [Serratia quinivorans]CAI1876699.1 Uncharacterised protein [Serratia quinivorans]